MRREIICVLVLLCIGHSSFCQGRISGNRGERESIVEEIVESLFENEEETEIPEETMDYLLFLASRPLDLNLSTQEDLERMKFLSPFQVDAILNYRREYGAFFSYHEMALIPGFDGEFSEKMQIFFTVGDGRENPAEGGRYLKPTTYLEGLSQVVLRMQVVPEKREGYLPVLREDYEARPDSRYLGNPLHLYGQYKYELDRKVGFIATTEKDAGEVGFDYISGSLYLNGSGRMKKIIIGDYTARFGQGLTVWRGFNFDSTLEPFDLAKREQGITPYGSSDENMAFRGVSALFEWGPLSLTGIFSSRNIDARVTEDGYTSLLTTGLHNTNTTLSRRKSLGWRVAALNAGVNTRYLKIGITLSADKKGLPYAGRSALLLEREQKFNGYNGNIGIDWRYVRGRLFIFGEGAADIAGSAAFVGGAMYRGDVFELSSRIRYEPEQYLSTLSTVNGTKGDGNISAKFSLKVTGLRNIRVYLNSDIGKNYFKISSKAEYIPSRVFKAELRSAFGNGRNSLRSDFRLNFGEYLTLHTRADVTFSDFPVSGTPGTSGTSGELLSEKRYGMHFHQEAILSGYGKLSLSARAAWFKAEEWNNRIYSYERDILYAFKTTTLYGEGWRWYLNVKYELRRGIDLWLKFSRTDYTDRDTVGEGLEKISGPSKSEIKVQLRFRY